jgi:hypothetical protein
MERTEDRPRNSEIFGWPIWIWGAIDPAAPLPLRFNSVILVEVIPTGVVVTAVFVALFIKLLGVKFPSRGFDEASFY